MLMKRNGKYVFDGPITFEGESITVWRGYEVTFTIDGVDLIVAIHNHEGTLDSVTHHGAADNWHTPYKEAQEAIDYLVARNVVTLVRPGDGVMSF